MPNIPDNYYDILAHIESSNNPFAQAATSSASGLYQFTKSTFTNLGFNWADRFNVDTQNTAIQKMTGQNANILTKNNIPVDSGSLYAAHFLGPTQAVNALQADNSTPLNSVVSSAAIIANPFLKGMKVGDFKDWLAKKTTGVGQSSQVTTFAGKDVTVTDNLLDNVLHGLGVDTSGIDKLFTSIDPSNIGASAAKATGTESIFQFVGNLFSINTGMRLVAVIIGVGLVIIAVVFLTNTDKVLVQAAKTAAIAA